MNEENKSHQTWMEGRVKGKKLTGEQVREMVQKAKDGGRSARSLGIEYGVSATLVGVILRQFGVPLPLGGSK